MIGRSLHRTGLITLEGVGGVLIGISVNLGLTAVIPGVSSELARPYLKRPVELEAAQRETVFTGETWGCEARLKL